MEKVVTVHLNHLEAMGICMALMTEEQQDGLSQPQRDALEKVQNALGPLMLEMYTQWTETNGKDQATR